MRPFTEDETQRIVAWFNERPIRQHCPACGVNVDDFGKWQLQKNFLLAPLNVRNGLFVPDPAVCSMVALSCPRCAYLLLFSAITIGLVQPVILDGQTAAPKRTKRKRGNGKSAGQVET